MAETFGRTTKAANEVGSGADYQFACKFQSGSAGSLASISFFVKYVNANTHVKCAIFDSSFNLLTNGATEEKVVPVNHDDWLTFNFSTAPSVQASTDYWLAWWSDKEVRRYQEAGSTDQLCYDAKTYNSWNDPLTPDNYGALEVSIYATYEAAAVKTLVQAALISIPPLVVLPTLAEILKLTGGC